MSLSLTLMESNLISDFVSFWKTPQLHNQKHQQQQNQTNKNQNTQAKQQEIKITTNPTQPTNQS